MAGSGLLKNARSIRANLSKHGVTGEIEDLRKDTVEALANLCALTVEEFLNVPAASAAGVLVAVATTVAPMVKGASDLVGGVATILPFPRPVSVTTAGTTPADAPATVKVIGKDVTNKVLEETINVGQTATTVVGAKCFKVVERLEFSAADGTGATVSVGWGAPIGLSLKPKARAGSVFLDSEFAAGARVTTGTISDPATNAPFGMYTPASAPNGTNDYVLKYEYIP